MINNKKYFLYGSFYLALCEFVLLWGFGFAMFFLLTIPLGKPTGLEGLMFASLSLYAALFGLLLSWLIYFLTIGKIYIKLGANFNFKHPVLFTSIIIFVLGNILFYFAMLAWFAVK